ncbi:unnamed protein product [Rotaria sp. Silwood1]|nr:unnamed protein product [Rotaria sp. Silwood1]
MFGDLSEIPPEYPAGDLYQVLTRQWIKSLQTSKSIVKHVAVFEQNLCELVEKLKQLAYLDIYGQIKH